MENVQTISESHRLRLDQIRWALHDIGCKESQFTKIELLFYEALDISRSYGNDVGSNPLLADLRKVHEDQYEKTHAHTKKPGQREQLIRKFLTRLKKVLNDHTA